MLYEQRHIPGVKYVDLYPGDMLYNPDFQWHTIVNFEGLSIGTPIRELNSTLAFRNNPLFSSIVALNKFLDRFGLDQGGYPDVNIHQED
jgi:hypothetical protein